MNAWQGISIVTLGFLASWLLIPIICRLSAPFTAERGRQFHQTHSTPISRFGGAALAASFILVALVSMGLFHASGVRLRDQWIVVCGSLGMLGLGLLDDVRPLGAKNKLLIQILIATGVFVSGIEVSRFKNPITHTEYDLGLLSYFATVIWLVTLTNLINLIDGIDGLAGGICLMLMALLAYVTHHQPFCLMISLGMAGGLGGFLVFNFPPAKIYMGDGGAYFLGFLIAILTMVSSNKGAVAAALIAPLFALALPIVDVSLAIVRRGLKGLPIFRPDRKHIHHRLMATGISKFKAVLLLYSISLACLGLAFVIFWSDARLLPFVFGLACLIFLAAAGSLSFSREWFSVGRVVGNSLEVRKQTRFALLLSRWMILEAERCLKIEDLWIDYLFVLRKLGFLKVRIELEEGAVEHTFAESNGLEPQKFRVSVETGNIRSLELQSPGHIDPKASELQSELAAEIWLNALRRWTVYHEVPPNLSQTETAPVIPASLAPA